MISSDAGTINKAAKAIVKSDWWGTGPKTGFLR
jgi:hypothetical protein